jgi:uncharacterized repeat protein (TIGR01451 family)
MRVLNHKLTVALLAAAVLGTAPSAWALGTAAGTSIDNRATIVYTVGATSQTPIESSPAGNSTPGATNGADTSFLVDNRVDLTITNQDGANVTVVPSQTGAVTEYLVTNTGNETQDYRLTASNGGAEPYATPPLDSFDVNTPITVFVEDGVNAGYQPAEDTATFIDELAANGTATVYVVADMPGALATNALSVVSLRATTADAGAAGLGGDTAETAGADNAAAIDVVFGDPDSDADTFPDGYEETQGAYVVQTAALTITKTSAVISDPFNGGTNPKAIPGAIVEYTVTIANAGPAGATNVTVTDDLSTEIGLGTVSFDANAYGAGEGLRVTAPNINGGAALDLTNVTGDDEGEWDDAAADTVIVNGIDLTAGQSATLTYRVTITYP